MPIFVVKIVVGVLAAFPLAINHYVGALIGRIAWVTRSRLRRITEVNLALCFPEMPQPERDSLARQSLIQTGMTLTESAWIWRRPREEVASLIRETRGAELFEQAQKSGKGLIIASPHMGCWELCNLPVSDNGDITYLYRSPRNPAIEPLLIEWRSNLGGKPARLDAPGIRHVLRVLKQGQLIGLLPDQEPDADNGVQAPFYGVHAHTMTLLAKLASRNNVEVLFCLAERLPKGRGWRIHFVKPEPGIADSDKMVAAAALNRTVERCIELCPSQYMWNYKRFRLQPDGTHRDYR
ncbi:MAG: lysophospholipid acyltransferase family protein [Granulosicoccus sp.]